MNALVGRHFFSGRGMFLPVLLTFICLFSLPSWAEEQEEPEIPLTAEQRIEQVNQDLRELVESLNAAKGVDKDAIQLQLFQKNEELREEIAKAVGADGVTNTLLVEQVRLQQKYSEHARVYIERKLEKLSTELDDAKTEEKLVILNTFQELQHYLGLAYTSMWQDLEWLNDLGKESKKTEEIFRDRMTKRLRLLSASIEYFGQQQELLTTQILSAPESEKPGLQLNQLILKKRLDIATESLGDLLSTADDMGLTTAEYKRLIFEVTGSVTSDLLNTHVIFAILTDWSDKAIAWFTDNAPQHVFKLFIFIAILLVARALANVVRSVVKKTVTSKNLKFSVLMQDFFISMSGKMVMCLGILIGLSQIGLNLAPILTGFGIAGVIVGFALQDTLSNFAAGMMLLIYRPFDVGDFVYAGGVDGKVSHMSLVNTTIRTFDNQIIIVPNSKIWGDVIKNVTHERIRRVDMVFGIGYGDDLLKAENVLHDIVTAHPAVLRSPEPMIKVHTLNTSSVDFIVRPWVKTDDYWDVYWDVTKEVKLRFDREGISIPFPQQDVHLHMIEKNEA
ncbi:mechanosensitive ion channel domain-containing protein [Vibrio sp. NTOU-M3]|uniref:mechanosensitive ion channel family protein n=1 Tax=Vibrio sp. NTOU-M3 TaxID=3234954 RepID=UPI0035A94CC8